MTEAYHEEEYKGIKIEIHPYDDAESPRNWDNFGVMKCFHTKYNLGDEKRYNTAIDELKDILTDNGIEISDVLEDKLEYEFSHNEAVDYLMGKLEEIAVVLPLYLYDHSGITMNTGGLTCSWDSGQVGFIYATKEQIRKEFNVRHVTKKVREKAIKLLNGEVKTYDQYLTGDVLGYVVKDPEGYGEDSCWGFYGFDYCLEEAKAIAKHMYKEKLKAKCMEIIESGKRSLKAMDIDIILTHPKDL